MIAFFFEVPKTIEEKGEIDARSVYVGNVSKIIIVRNSKEFFNCVLAPAETLYGLNLIQFSHVSHQYVTKHLLPSVIAL